DQERRRLLQSGDAVDTFDELVGDQVGPGGHEEADGTASPSAHAILARPSHRQLVGRRRFARNEMPIAHLPAIVNRDLEAGLVVREMNDIRSDLLPLIPDTAPAGRVEEMDALAFLLHFD